MAIHCRADGQIAEGHPPQVALGQPPLHLAVHAGIPEGTHPNAAREAYLQANPQALLAASGGVIASGTIRN